MKSAPSQTEQVVSEAERYLWGVARNMASDPNLRDELAQVGIVRYIVVRRDKPGEEDAYYRRAAINRMYDVLRSNARYHRTFVPSSSHEELVESIEVAEIEDATLDGLTASAILSLVSEPHQELLVMKAHRYTYSEMGDALGINPAAAKSRYRRAVRAARDAINSLHAENRLLPGDPDSGAGVHQYALPIRDDQDAKGSVRESAKGLLPAMSRGR